jgi:hypothetical protein
VLKTHDRTDLERLQKFAESMLDGSSLQPAHKVSKLACVFVSVATLYIESREQEARKARAGQQKPVVPSSIPDYKMGNDDNQQTSIPEWAPIDPFLRALGFAEDPSLSMNGVSGATADLENWYNGNQHIMGLLEDDLSYLDDAAMSFEAT